MESNEQRAGERDAGGVPFVFPRWSNWVPQAALPVGLFAATGLVLAVWYWGSPKFLFMGYAPKQPVAYSHKMHAGDLGIDCRYCHIAVERGPLATVPATEICMNCHGVVRANFPTLEWVRKSNTTGESIPWVRIHRLADFAYFDHSRHVTKGVGCVECHGRVDQMDVVRASQPLSMSWCLDCHRDPAPRLRPREEITNMAWTPDGRESGLVEKYRVNPPTGCSGCHR